MIHKDVKVNKVIKVQFITKIVLVDYSLNSGNLGHLFTKDFWHEVLTNRRETNKVRN